MSNFLKLIQNENMKIYRRVRTWVMTVILAALTIMQPVLFALVSGMDEASVVDVMHTQTYYFLFITLFTVMIAAGMIAGEFSSGTIKLLLFLGLSWIVFQKRDVAG